MIIQRRLTPDYFKRRALRFKIKIVNSVTQHVFRFLCVCLKTASYPASSYVCSWAYEQLCLMNKALFDLCSGSPFWQVKKCQQIITNLEVVMND